MRGGQTGAWWRSAAVIATVAVGAASLAGCGSTPGPGATIAAYTTALDHRDPAALSPLLAAPSPTVADTYRAMYRDLHATGAAFSAAAPVVHGSQATAALTTTVHVAAYGPVTLRSTLHLHQHGSHWLVEWSPTTVADQLGAGDHFAVSETWPARAAVLGAGGAPLTPAGVSVGLVGQRITDPQQLSALLTGAGFAAATVTSALAAAVAHPTQLVPVGVVPQSTYETLKASPGTTLYSIGGTAFSLGAQAPLTPDLGAHLVGTVGPITADQLTHLGAPYQAGDQVGQDGIEALDERQLAGTPAITVEIVDAKGASVATLASRPAAPGNPVTTSIDPTVQRAAEAALASLPATTQAAMVVERASTGEVVASVSRPLSTPFDLALDGQAPPGSTFKVVTSAALLQHGDTPSTPATCPATRTVDGQTFRNFEGEASPDLDLAQAFAVSCNTAFIGLAGSLPDPAIPQAATLFGLGTTPHAGVPVAGTSVPTPSDANELAATSIGQGRVTVSPLAMASVAAAVDSGAYHPPRLVAGAADDTATATPLPAPVDAALKTMMAGVVMGDGTAAGAGLPVGTYGKTGTAEFGSGPNPPTHAWFIGFRGDLAFAVFVYGGGVGGVVAAPLAATLLKALPASG